MWARNPGWDVCVPTEGPRGLEVRMRERFLRKFLTKVMAEIVRHTQVIKKEKKMPCVTRKQPVLSLGEQ